MKNLLWIYIATMLISCTSSKGISIGETELEGVVVMGQINILSTIPLEIDGQVIEDCESGAVTFLINEISNPDTADDSNLISVEYSLSTDETDTCTLVGFAEYTIGAVIEIAVDVVYNLSNGSVATFSASQSIDAIQTETYDSNIALEGSLAVSEEIAVEKGSIFPKALPYFIENNWDTYFISNLSSLLNDWGMPDSTCLESFPKEPSVSFIKKKVGNHTKTEMEGYPFTLVGSNKQTKLQFFDSYYISTANSITSGGRFDIIGNVLILETTNSCIKTFYFSKNRQCIEKKNATMNLGDPGNVNWFTIEANSTLAFDTKTIESGKYTRGMQECSSSNY